MTCHERSACESLTLQEITNKIKKIPQRKTSQRKFCPKDRKCIQFSGIWTVSNFGNCPLFSVNPIKTSGTMPSIPPGKPCWESPPTRKHFLFLNKNISLIREYYMNV